MLRYGKGNDHGLGPAHLLRHRLAGDSGRPEALACPANATEYEFGNIGPLAWLRPPVRHAEGDRIERANPDRSIVLRARNQQPLPVVPLERLERAIRRVNKPQEPNVYRFNLRLSTAVSISQQDMLNHVFDVTNGRLVHAGRGLSIEGSVRIDSGPSGRGLSLTASGGGATLPRGPSRASLRCLAAPPAAPTPRRYTDRGPEPRGNTPPGRATGDDTSGVVRPTSSSTTHRPAAHASAGRSPTSSV